MENSQLLFEIRDSIAELRKALPPVILSNEVTRKWIPRKDLMAFLDYGATQMAELEKSGELVVTKVGKRKFILRDSLEKWLERNIQECSQKA